MLQLIHAFDHVHYLRYLTYQHVTFSYFKMTKHPIFSDLKINGFAAQYSEEKFSAVHGDLVTEYYNRETKSCHGPFRLGFSTNVSVMNKWVMNINSHAQLQKELRGTLSMKVNSTHKERWETSTRRHQSHVRSLKFKLAEYGHDPFADKDASEIRTGKLIDVEVSESLLAAAEKGNTLCEEFIQKRLVSSPSKVSFFSRVPKNSIIPRKTAKRTSSKSTEILKEDCQAFA